MRSGAKQTARKLGTEAASLAGMNANTGAKNMTTTFGVYFLLSFDYDHRDARGVPSKKMGRGEAGYTAAYFATEAEAQSFADSIPACSRVANHGVWSRK